MTIEKQNRINAQQRRLLRRAVIRAWAFISLKRRRTERQQQHLERCYEASRDLKP
ncbi:MAG: hypothetical protein AAF959_08250 [Cyanobacteria bacterium P01_D01_bin.56]